MQKQITIADILSEYGESYISRSDIRGQEKGLIHLLSACHSQFMGSHFEKCDKCSYLGKAYNSCRNRHCPSCQQKDKLEWMDKRMQELLPVGYYHLVFTIPHELNLLCLKNKRIMYNILFNAASQTLLELSRDTKHLGADIGLITVLHTWGQNMMEHPHLHCIMPEGGLSFDKGHVLPLGFFKVRYYGIFASRCRKENIETARQHLVQEQELAGEQALEDGLRVWEKQDPVWNEILQIIMNYRKPNCPHCHNGRLRFAGLVPRNHCEPG